MLICEKWLLRIQLVKFVLMFDAMFKYVNLMIIVLMMLNLHAWNVYMVILCVLLKIDEEWCGCCWIVDEFMFNRCCYYYEMLLLMICTLGVHNFGFVVWIKLLLKVFIKMGGFDELCWNNIWFHVWCLLKALLSITDDCSHKRAGSELEANNYWK